MGDGISWKVLQERHEHLGSQLLDSHLDAQRRQKVQREYSMLSTVLTKHADIEFLQQQLDELSRQKETTLDPEFAELLGEEMVQVTQRVTREREALDRLLFPPDELNTRDAFVEIRAGTGGQEAALFAGDLMRMYLLYATRRGWHASVISESPTDLGGYREVVLQIQGEDVYGHLRHESGVHRVQRVPVTETAGRVHTSTATVAVLPEASEVEAATIDPRDLRIDVYRSSGAGGQHVNTTDSAVRITHIPTGLVVACQDERSQHKNKAKALKVLQSRLRALQEEKQAAEASEQRKKLIGTGERAEKVRTYNVPQNRVSDHQVDVTLKCLDLVFEGHLEQIIDALRARDEDERRKRPLPWLHVA